MTQKKKEASSKKNQKNTLDNNLLRYEIIVLSFFAFSLLAFISIYLGMAGALGEIINNIFFGLFGVGAYLIPILMFVASFFKIFNKGNRWLNHRIYLSITLFVIISIFAHVINIDGAQIGKEIYGQSTFFKVLLMYYKISVNSQIAGGLIGGLFGDILLVLLGKIGTYIVLILIIISLTILLTEKSLFNSLRLIGNKLKESKYTFEKKEASDEKTEIVSVNSTNNNKEETSNVPKPNPISIDDQPIKEEDLKEVLEPEIINEDIKKPKKSVQTTSEDIDIQISVDNNIDYKFPSINLLKENPFKGSRGSRKAILSNAEKLEKTLESFGVKAKVLNVSCGPTVTRYELQPEQGVKVSKIVGLSDDIALNLAASGIRIEAPIPGKSAVGIEVPNKEVSSVYLREVIDSEEFKKFPSNVAFAIGKDIAGKVIVSDIGKMPHMLIAGATGSGKSVCINTLITSIIYKSSPKEVRLVMIDPKVVELSVYNGIPHLLIPVVTDPKKAAGALNWAVSEMSDRYKLFAAANVRDIKGYNKYVELTNEGDVLPQIVIIVDELADLMMVAPNDVEDAICRLAQMARAAGIHLIIATQRPSVDVITGLIKANIPSRIAFSVSSGTDSRTIIDMNGAEKLLGKGDMLFYPVGMQKPVRVQGAFISDKEVESIVEDLKASQKAIYNEKIMSQITTDTNINKQNDNDEYYQEALEFVIEKQKASASMIQRKFRVGYNRAARIVEQLNESGIVGPEEGSKPRKVLITKEEYEQMKSDASKEGDRDPHFEEAN